MYTNSPMFVAFYITFVQTKQNKTKWQHIYRLQIPCLNVIKGLFNGLSSVMWMSS